MIEYENCICFLLVVFLMIVFGFMVMYTHHRESFTMSMTTGNCKNIPPMFKKAFGGIPNEYYPAGSDVPALPLGANETMVFHSPGHPSRGSCTSNINGVNRSGQRYVSTNTSYCSEGSRNHFDTHTQRRDVKRLYY